MSSKISNTIKKKTKQNKKKQTNNKDNDILDKNKYWLFTPIQWLTISLFIDTRKSDSIEIDVRPLVLLIRHKLREVNLFLKFHQNKEKQLILKH